MNNAVVVRTQKHLIACIIVYAFDKIINMLRFRNMRPEFVANQVPADLAAVSIQKLQILSDFLIQLTGYHINLYLSYGSAQSDPLPPAGSLC